jgi:hypothetical protein
VNLTKRFAFVAMLSSTHGRDLELNQQSGLRPAAKLLKVKATPASFKKCEVDFPSRCYIAAQGRRKTEYCHLYAALTT